LRPAWANGETPAPKQPEQNALEAWLKQEALSSDPSSTHTPPPPPKSLPERPDVPDIKTPEDSHQGSHLTLSGESSLALYKMLPFLPL
jgi:hypothetical protein